MDLQDARARLLCRMREFDLAIETAGPARMCGLFEAPMIRLWMSTRFDAFILLCCCFCMKSRVVLPELKTGLVFQAKLNHSPRTKQQTTRIRISKHRARHRKLVCEL
jgi:hypothetical protein